MKLKTFLTLNAMVAIVAGLGFALEWGPILETFFSPGYAILSQNPSEAAMITWLLASFARMFGMLLFGLGVLTLAVREVAEKSVRRKIVIALMLAWAFTALMAWMQQLGIWDTPAGWLFVLFCAVQAGGYAVYFFQGELDTWRPRSQPLSQEDRDYNLELIRYVTQNYSSLQGLRFVPLGLWFFILATGWFGSSGALNFFGIAGLIVAAVSWWWVGRYYQRAFGVVKEAKKSPGWLVGAIAFFVLYFLASWLDRVLRLPLTITLSVIGGMLVICWFFPVYRRRLHYLVMGILLIGAGLFFSFGMGLSLDSETHRQFLTAFLNLTIGLICVLGGLIDHLILVRAFKPFPQEAGHE